MSESFLILEEAGMLPEHLRARLVWLAGFRSVLAQDYDRLDYAVVHDVRRRRLKGIDEFAELVSELIAH